MTAALIGQVTDAFNRHGKFTARRIVSFGDPATEVRYAETGEVAATVWAPSSTAGAPQWFWLGGQPGMGFRYLPASASIEELVRAVATHVLDETRRP